VSLTEGQLQAIAECKAIDEASEGAIEVRRITTPEGRLEVELSISCAGLPSVDGGLQLRKREVIAIVVPATFPFRPPFAWTRDRRFARQPHVQWGRYLCLYRAPAVEWSPSDGMFGFVERLVEWLRRSSSNERLFEGDAPLHPPIAYPSEDTPVVVPRANTPGAEHWPWLGMARMRAVADRLEVVGWHKLGDKLDLDEDESLGAALLLKGDLPYEFPKKVADLLDELVKAGGSRGVLQGLLLLTASRNAKENPLFVLLGTPMRGDGSGARQQHLACWRLGGLPASCLELGTNIASDHPEIAAIGQRGIEIFQEWTTFADAEWTRVMEARPEVTRPRDAGRPVSLVRGKTVAIWGCGALGGHAAVWLARAGVAKLILYDKSRVTPGVLARQPYHDGQIGRPKTEALATTLRKIRPDLEVVEHQGDLHASALQDDDWTAGAHLVIDASASNPVSHHLELRRRRGQRVVPVISMVIDGEARLGLCTAAGAEATGGPLDLSLQSRLAVAAGRRDLLRAFWPDDPTPPLEPEPGCSSPTFIGAATDVAGLAARMLNRAMGFLLEGPADARSWFVSAIPSVAEASYTFPPATVSVDARSGYEVRIRRSALREMRAWSARSARVRGPRVETGGLLFGVIDHSMKTVWVLEASGPPPDSQHSAHGFICGTAGVANELAWINKVYGDDLVSYVGMWHSHPESTAVPSGVDVAAMRSLTSPFGANPRAAAMVILGRTTTDRPHVGAFVFERHELRSGRPESMTLAALTRRLAKRPSGEGDEDFNIGLALSGGGSRAIAFHLGCLRALDDLGLLQRVRWLSTVSGGSVVGALWAYADDDFGDFEVRVTSLLKNGLTSSILQRAVVSLGAIRGALAVTVTALATAWYGCRRAAAWLGLSSGPVDAPTRPFTRTDALAATLAALGLDRGLDTVQRDGLEMIINATDLLTGTAFRFGSEKSGGHRQGVLGTDVRVCEAVAASAAYPVLLPPLDRTWSFETAGKEAPRRVLLTDGGIYENLGVMPFEPGRNPDVSIHTCSPEIIVACDAGVGVMEPRQAPIWWPARMYASFDTTFRRVQNDTRARLHRHVEAGRVGAFIMPYLGQSDARVPFRQADDVPRERVVDYPTDFAPMSAEDIRAISDRGEQLTRRLVRRYLGHQ